MGGASGEEMEQFLEKEGRGKKWSTRSIIWEFSIEVASTRGFWRYLSNQYKRRAGELDWCVVSWR